MKIAILGNGVEGKALAKYFGKKGDEITTFDNFTDEKLERADLSNFDDVFRSPSVRPYNKNWDSMTKYFFKHCKAPIIGVTGTKGKGTTCSIIHSLLSEIIKNSDWSTRTLWLVGNIGKPSISVLDQIEPDDVVIYEMSSFQLWDLTESPHIAVVLRVEEDHLDRHFNLEDYHEAKANIARYQTKDDFCVYYKNNKTSEHIGNLSKGKKIIYPITPSGRLKELLDLMQVPGDHNKENAEAAIAAVACFLNMTPEELLEDNKLFDDLKNGIKNFKGLPHRLQFIRELDGVKYYDDNFSSAFPATDVAIKTFEDYPTVLIAGGKDRHLNLEPMKNRLFSAQNLKKIILIGENKELLAKDEPEDKYVFANSLEEAVNLAKTESEKYENSIVLMSPGSASFDMFKNFEDRGQKFQKIVNNL